MSRSSIRSYITLRPEELEGWYDEESQMHKECVLRLEEKLHDHAYNYGLNLHPERSYSVEMLQWGAIISAKAIVEQKHQTPITKAHPEDNLHRQPKPEPEPEQMTREKAIEKSKLIGRCRR